MMAQIEVMNTRAASFAKDGVALDPRTADEMAKLQFLTEERTRLGAFSKPRRRGPSSGLRQAARFA